MLRVDPEERITAEQALAHPYFNLTEELLLSDKGFKPAICSTEDETILKETEKENLIKDSCLDFRLGK
jgi:hypothetical protein